MTHRPPEPSPATAIPGAGEAGVEIPVMRPVPPSFERVAERLRAVHGSGRFANFGPQVLELEERFASFLGTAPERVATASSATQGILGALSVSAERRWTVPSWTFTGTVAAALGAGKELRFADVRRRDWWVDPEPSEEAGGGLVAVAPFGVGFGAEAWAGGGEVVVDAAASLGAGPVDLDRLGPGAAVVFSLHATKALGCGEGGLVVFGDSDRAERFRSWSNFGFAGTRESRAPGSNAKMAESAAAYAHAALDEWPEALAEWTGARRLATELEEAHGLRPHPGAAGEPGPYWVVTFSGAAAREAAESALAAHGIGTRRWWGEGCHRMPAYREIRRGPLPHTEAAAATALGLPMFRGMTGEEAERVSAALHEAAAG